MGTYLEGRRHAVFVVAPDLMGLSSWGRPDVDDVRELLRWCEVGTGPALPPHRFLVDIRALEGVEPATFIQFVDYVRRNGAALSTQIVRQAQLRPEGLVGAIISGFAQVARPPYPEKVFREPVDALDWLDIPADEGFALLGELEAIRSARVGGFDAVTQLHRLFETRGVVPIETAARSLSLSVRSLQRTLRAAGTTYVTEARAFRIARAKDFLRTSDRHLGWIALELGFSSSQHFATEFRRAVGVTPSQWRARLVSPQRASERRERPPVVCVNRSGAPMDAAAQRCPLRRSTMTSSMFVSKIGVVGVLALTVVGCSSSGSSSSGDYKASKNGCEVTFTGAYTGSGACKDFSAESSSGQGAFIALTMQDQPATGFIGSFSANITKGFSTGTFGAADGTMNYTLQKSDSTDGFTATDGSLKIDSADHWGNGGLYELSGSFTIDMQPGTGLKSTTPLHVVITF